jgi:hypothetical protein
MIYYFFPSSSFLPYLALLYSPASPPAQSIRTVGTIHDYSVHSLSTQLAGVSASEMAKAGRLASQKLGTHGEDLWGSSSGTTFRTSNAHSGAGQMTSERPCEAHIGFLPRAGAPAGWGKEGPWRNGQRLGDAVGRARRNRRRGARLFFPISLARCVAGRREGKEYIRGKKKKKNEKRRPVRGDRHRQQTGYRSDSLGKPEPAPLNRSFGPAPWLARQADQELPQPTVSACMGGIHSIHSFHVSIACSRVLVACWVQLYLCTYMCILPSGLWNMICPLCFPLAGWSIILFLFIYCRHKQITSHK